MKIRFALIAGFALSLGACQSKTTEVTENTVETNAFDAVGNSEGDNVVISDAELGNSSELENGTGLENGTDTH